MSSETTISTKDWEIIEYISPKYNTTRFIWKKEDDGMFHYEMHRFSENALISNEFRIYSVKRLNDGVIFTIGDSVKVNDEKIIKNCYGNITKFRIIDDGDIDIVYNHYHQYSISKFIKLVENDPTISFNDFVFMWGVSCSLESSEQRDEQRDGQRLMNLLCNNWKSEYNKIVKGYYDKEGIDCFYDDNLIENTLKHLEEVWPKI